MTDLNKTKERIAKLLAMAKDTASPNEAAIAAARARKLMDKYQLEEFDISAATVEMKSAACDKPYKFTPVWKNILTVAVAKYNDCHGVNSPMLENDSRNTLGFRGFADDVDMAIDMYKTLTNACEEQCKAYMMANGMGSYYVAKVGDAFKKHWAHEVVAKLRSLTAEREALVSSAGTSLVLAKSHAVAEFFGDISYNKVSIESRNEEEVRRAALAGKRAGEIQEINSKIDQ